MKKTALSTAATAGMLLAAVLALVLGVPAWLASHPAAAENPGLLLTLLMAMSKLLRNFWPLLIGILIFFTYMFLFLLFLLRMKNR